MYALAVILGIALWTQDVNVVKYAQPLALVGVALAAFHCLLYLGYMPKGIQPCSQDVPCNEVKLQISGFVTIPLNSRSGCVVAPIRQQSPPFVSWCGR